MNTNRDRLDETIELVSARMTAVEADAALALRIVRSLPERSVWLPRVWISRFAMGALATLAVIVVLRTFDGGSTNVLRTNNDRSTEVPRSFDGGSTKEPAPVVPDRRTIVERSLNVRRTAVEIERPDHERSLPAIEAVAALAVDALTSSELASEPAVELEPLVIADLPLSAAFPPR